MATTLTANPKFPVANYGSGGLGWNPEKAERAAKAGKFIRVTLEPGAKQTSSRTLSGAERHWFNPADNKDGGNGIYNLQYRLTGTPEAVQRALEYAQKTPQEIQTALRESITRDNYQGVMAAAFNNEIAQAKAIKDGKAPTQRYDYEHLIWMIARLDRAQVTNKETGEVQGPIATGGRGGRGESWAQKLEKARAGGKTIDVSEMDATGKGARSTNQRKAPNVKNGKTFIPDVPILSNSLDKFVQALRLAYGADADTIYAAQINEFARRLSELHAAAPAAVPTYQPVVPGATIAPPPLFTAATTVPTVATPTGRVPPLSTVGGATFPVLPRFTTTTGTTRK